MSPPNFGDLGKDARDLLTKNYFFGVFSVKYNSTADKFKFAVNGIHNISAKKLASDFEVKVKFPNHGTTFTEKFTSDDRIELDIQTEDSVIDGLIQNFQLSQKAYDKDSTIAMIKNCLKMDAATIKLNLILKSAIPNVLPSVVVSHSGYVGGVDMQIDTADRQLQRFNFAVGYQVEDFGFHGLISNMGKSFSASLFQRLTDRLEMAGSVSWSRDSDQVAWSVGSKYMFDEDKNHSLKFKLDHLSRFSVSMTTLLSRGLQFSLCGLFNGPDVPQLGLGIELEC